MGNKGLGNSKERGRNLVPVKREKSLIKNVTCKLTNLRNKMDTKFLHIYNVLPFIGPPIRMTALIMFFPTV